MGEIYYELGYISVGLKEYEKAIHYFDEASKWNPIDPFITFERAAAFRMMGRIERFRAEITKTTDYIYNSVMVAKYFREMGWYYSEREEFDVANALYSKSLSYMDTKLARDELAYIAKRQNRNVRIDNIKDATKIIAEYNLLNGFRKIIVDTFMQQLEFLKNKEVKEQADWNNIDILKKALYDITLDQKYMVYIPLSYKDYGIQLDMPIIWKILKKDSYKDFGLNENTVAVFMISNDKKFSIMYDRDCTPENLEAAYTENIENMKKYGITIGSNVSPGMTVAEVGTQEYSQAFHLHVSVIVLNNNESPIPITKRGQKIPGIIRNESYTFPIWDKKYKDKMRNPFNHKEEWKGRY